jgi:hypothetical protein
MPSSMNRSCQRHARGPRAFLRSVRRWPSDPLDGRSDGAGERRGRPLRRALDGDRVERMQDAMLIRPVAGLSFAIRTFKKMSLGG